MDIMLIAIISFITGAAIYTTIGYVAKYLQSPTTSFNILYLFTSMLSMFLAILLSPTFLLPGVLPFTVSGISGQLFIIFGCFGVGFTANCLINLPVTFLLKQITTHNIIDALKPKPRILIYLLCLIGIIGLIGGASVNALAQYQASIHTTGTVTAVNCEIYANAQLTTPLTAIDWGVREPGSTKTVDVWVKNTGNTPVTLYQYTTNWSPSTAQNYMTLTWSYNNETIQPNGSLKVTLTLSVDSTISGITNFSFDITFVATG